MFKEAASLPVPCTDEVLAAVMKLEEAYPELWVKRRTLVPLPAPQPAAAAAVRPAPVPAAPAPVFRPRHRLTVRVFRLPGPPWRQRPLWQ
jgi:hypothetical protein